MKLQLPRNFDFTKLEPIGCYYLKTRSLSVYLFNYGRRMVYIPDIGLKELKNISTELYKVLENWFPIRIYQDEFDNNVSYGSIYFNRKNKLLTEYECSSSDKLIYNLFTLKNVNKKDGFFVAYSPSEEVEGLYKNKQLISGFSQQFEYYRHLLIEEREGWSVVDTTKGMIKKINLKYILQVTDDYVIGVDFRDRHSESYYLLKVISKEEVRVLYENREGKIYNGAGLQNSYRLVGNRYLAVDSYQYGVLDLETGGENTISICQLL